MSPDSRKLVGNIIGVIIFIVLTVSPFGIGIVSWAMEQFDDPGLIIIVSVLIIISAAIVVTTGVVALGRLIRKGAQKLARNVDARF